LVPEVQATTESESCWKIVAGLSRRVSVKVHRAILNLVSRVMEEQAWLGYGSVEEFVEDAVRHRLEFLVYLSSLEVA